MKNIVFPTLAVILSLTAGTALAKGDDWKKEFSKADTNGDEKLSMSEWDAHGKEMFKEIDANGDQQVSMDEKRAYKEKKHGDMKKKESM